MKIILLIGSIFLLTACESVEKWTQFEPQPLNQASISDNTPSLDDEEYLNNELSSFDVNGTFIHRSLTGLQAPAINKKYALGQNRNINHFIRGISHELIENLKYVNEQTPVAVASFVLLDVNLDNAGVLGQQIAESFQHEIYKFGIPVIDFKTTDFLRVTPDGDFILSRDFLELKPNLPIEYVLMGTLVKHDAGYLVNARIVGLESKAIVGSAQGFLPEYITAALLDSKKHEGIKLE